MIETSDSNASLALPTKMLVAVLEKWNQAGEQHLVPIAGSSMRPLIRPGDQVLIKHGYTNARPGDIIVFLQGEKMIAHRLLRICHNGPEPTFVTKGDNNSYFDASVGIHQIVGRVLKIKRGSRWLSIDTRVWRIGGWLIAVGMLGWATLYRWGRKIKHRLFGPEA